MNVTSFLQELVVYEKIRAHLHVTLLNWISQ